MMQTDVEIINKLGLHVRAATHLVKLASSFDIDITLSCNGQTADAKSIMDVLMLAGTTHTILRIEASGSSQEEEDQAIEKITDLIKNRFYEKE
ncbi:MAG: HPr family phosphocarrier protein [Deltaproteobacteria bacterium]|nr:HPr family phosphocarrier protein [Deltaproteobacteria bacterium]